MLTVAPETVLQTTHMVLYQLIMVSIDPQSL